MNNYDITKEIRKMLIDLDMSAGDLANELGVHRSTWGMAINKLRTGPSAIALLERAKSHLESKQCDNCHHIN